MKILRKVILKKTIFLEKINLKEYFEEIYERNLRRKTKEFVGREKFGDQAQTHLYPDLKIPDSRRGAIRSNGGME